MKTLSNCPDDVEQGVVGGRTAVDVDSVAETKVGRHQQVARPLVAATGLLMFCAWWGSTHASNSDGMSDVLSNTARDDGSHFHTSADEELFATSVRQADEAASEEALAHQAEVSAHEDEIKAEEDEEAPVEDGANGPELTDDTPYGYTSCTDPTLGPVLGGYDVVQYRYLEPEDYGVMGDEEIYAYHREYKYLFISEENKVEFLAAPEYYIPAFGGFCSYGVSRETVWTPSNMGPTSDPEQQWIIFNDRLFLNRGAVAQLWFRTHPSMYLDDGTSQWTDWYGNGDDTFDIIDGPKNVACFNDDHECNGCDDDDAPQQDDSNDLETSSL